MIGKQLVISIIGLLIVSGCAAAPGPLEGEPPGKQPVVQDMRTARVIIKFRDPGLDASRSDIAESLSAHAGTNLAYLRSISVGAHVFYLEDVPDRDALTEIIRRLSERPDILYVEEDRIMRHQLER
ncbi:MAG: hypothetical protein JW950_09670 [Deltaproteobacteria bacterium]|nr:hypothetical protein [Deltaproteobacteria bacterium]